MQRKSFDVTERDFVDAQRLLYRSGPAVRRFRVVVVLAFAAWVLWVTLLTWEAHRIDWINVVWVALVAALAGALLYRTRVGFPRHWGKIYRQQKGLHEPVELELSATEVRSTRKSGFNTVAMRDLVGWVEDGDTVLLLHSDVAANILPKRCFSDAELTALRTWLTAAGVAQRYS